jgi:hypothetical protein
MNPATSNPQKCTGPCQVAPSAAPAGLPAEEADRFDELAAGLDDLRRMFARIESALTLLVEQRTAKEWYTTAEVAKIVGKGEYTVREWCRQGRIRAKKKPCGRGKGGEWLISHDELTRLRNEGLLPFQGQV